MRVMVTGAGGMLGRDVTLMATARGHEVVAADRAKLDITVLGAVRQAVRAAEPAVVVNCAAYTDVDGAEENVRTAMAVNALGPRNLALACRDTGAALMQVSTDYVFDGLKGTPYGIFDPPAPLNVYGRSKLLGELLARDTGVDLFVLRTSWLFGPGGPSFVETMLRLGRQGGRLRVVSDQWGSPTYTGDLARAMVDLMETGASGTYHVTNTGHTSWYGLAGEIFHRAGLAVQATPCLTRDFPRPAKRPLNSMLDPFPLEDTIGYLLPPWQDGLARYLATRP